jgi:zinc protease
MIKLRSTVSPFDQADIRHIASVEEQIQRDKALKLDEIKKLYTDFLGSQQGEISLVGDFDPDTCLPILRETFSGWSSGEAYARIPKKFCPHVKGGKLTIDTPDKSNAIYLAGLIFPMKDDDPDYPALVIGNFVLGGGSLSSRLGDRVRQKEGLSYGVGSFLGADSFDPRSSLTVFAICNPTNTPKVVSVIREELDRLLKDGITPHELEQAKSGYLQHQQVSRTRDSSLTSTLCDTAHTGRTMKYYADLERKINALTPEQVNEALRKHLDANRLVVVSAGDFRPGAESKSPKTGGSNP